MHCLIQDVTDTGGNIVGRNRKDRTPKKEIEEVAPPPNSTECTQQISGDGRRWGNGRRLRPGEEQAERCAGDERREGGGAAGGDGSGTRGAAGGASDESDIALPLPHAGEGGVSVAVNPACSLGAGTGWCSAGTDAASSSPRTLGAIGSSSSSSDSGTGLRLASDGRMKWGGPCRRRGVPAMVNEGCWRRFWGAGSEPEFAGRTGRAGPASHLDPQRFFFDTILRGSTQFSIVRHDSTSQPEFGLLAGLEAHARSHLDPQGTLFDEVLTCSMRFDAIPMGFDAIPRDYLLWNSRISGRTRRLRASQSGGSLEFVRRSQERVFKTHNEVYKSDTAPALNCGTPLVIQGGRARVFFGLSRRRRTVILRPKLVAHDARRKARDRCVRSTRRHKDVASHPRAANSDYYYSGKNEKEAWSIPDYRINAGQLGFGLGFDGYHVWASLNRSIRES
ncbi:hypothetical protein DFH09DRAFT_1113887 [Mycena vulgaris]|nr:hypothetical protein DFH09DRAFT_1113887 [Mycena vulgaris]